MQSIAPALPASNIIYTIPGAPLGVGVKKLIIIVM